MKMWKSRPSYTNDEHESYWTIIPQKILQGLQASHCRPIFASRISRCGNSPVRPGPPSAWHIAETHRRIHSQRISIPIEAAYQSIVRGNRQNTSAFPWRKCGGHDPGGGAAKKYNHFIPPGQDLFLPCCSPRSVLTVACRSLRKHGKAPLCSALLRFTHACSASCSGRPLMSVGLAHFLAIRSAPIGLDPG
ncbi:hypothetical protein BDZ85DRAFT_131281 [Elsinoe ampelina]|uniref:Uncharacterized protein n=1 Tax=Elsinoe ampelina TaxID=302913 RepID=A0A6A6GAT1_9PEZI|nr:hypothetical protein BDZ85DRAFT_131281 [Elsinoe ampelina]